MRVAADCDPQEAARLLYVGVLEILEATQHPYLIKAWNYLPDINLGEGDNERYKQFCLGRAEALEPYGAQQFFPAGTGVGACAGEDYQVTVLAGVTAPVPLENPRQVSAFRYPRDYGPRSPSFSRAAILGDADDRTLFISGTAAIVGHRSCHPTHLGDQVRETMSNWSSLFEAYTQVTGDVPVPNDQSAFRVYLRHETDLAESQSLLAEAGIPLERTMFLQADICRQELLFEIDGIIPVPADQKAP